MRSSRWLRGVLLAVLSLLALASCEGSDPSGAMSLEVTAVLTGDAVSVASMALSQDTPQLPAEPGRALRWELRDPERGVIASGNVTDPREARAEGFGEEGGASAGARGAIGAVTVRVPNTNGTLVVFERDDAGAWRELGRDRVFPLEAGRTSISVLDASRDVLGEPTLLVNNGSGREQVNLLIVPDGYTEAQLARFHTDAQQLVAGLRGVSGYAEHWSQFNVWLQDVRSVDSGIDDPSTGVVRNTAFEMSFGGGTTGRPQRCVVPDRGSQPTVIAWLDQARRRLNADVVVILANTDVYGGCAMPTAHVVTVTRHASALRVLAHEIAHTLFGLHDEYATNGYACDTSINGPNVTNDPTSPPWADLVDAALLPTPVAGTAPGTVGAFEGARWCTAGLYRPTANCMMRELSAPLCPVCRRVIARQLAARGAEVERMAAGVPGVAVRVTNRTGAYVFVRCDGGEGATCSGWVRLQPGASASVRTYGRRLVVDNTTVGDRSVTFQSTRLTAPGDVVTLYANDANPFSEP